MRGGLDALYAAHVDIRSRGRSVPPRRPLGAGVPPGVRRDRLLAVRRGALLIASAGGDIASHIQLFKPVDYWDAFEVS